MELFRCYAYGRLSKEDVDKDKHTKDESDSIKNQRDLLHTYIRRTPGLELTMEGYDDGYTGTNFDRPHFQEMLEAVKAGKVNCVVVKDLSRFGRERIHTGRYILKLFPPLGVRFIAINDGFDSNDPNSFNKLLLEVKSLINDTYCRDTSIKIRSHLDVKRRNGEFIGSFAPYGYCKDPENKNHLLVDTPAAETVRDIFCRRIAGQSCLSIADSLNVQGVLSPMEYKRAAGLNFESGYRVHAKTLWSAVAVRRILQNVVYLGVMEQGKRTTPNYKVKTVVVRPSGEWMRVEGTHEAIVGSDEFELVARLMLRDTRRAPGEDTVYPLAGLLCCGDCNGAMSRRSQSQDGKSYVYYICATHRADTGVCSPHSISEAKLETAILGSVNFHIRKVTRLQEALEAITRRPQRKLTVDRIDRQLAALRVELAQKQELKDALYRRFALGEVAQEDFVEFKRIFTRDCERVEEAITFQQKELDEILSSGNPDSPWIEQFKRCGRLQTLERSTLVRLIDRVMVYNDGRIEIIFRWQGELACALEFAALQNESVDLGKAV